MCDRLREGGNSSGLLYFITNDSTALQVTNLWSFTLDPHEPGSSRLFQKFSSWLLLLQLALIRNWAGGLFYNNIWKITFSNITPYLPLFSNTVQTVGALAFWNVIRRQPYALMLPSFIRQVCCLCQMPHLLQGTWAAQPAAECPLTSTALRPRFQLFITPPNTFVLFFSLLFSLPVMPDELSVCMWKSPSAQSPFTGEQRKLEF